MDDEVVANFLLGTLDQERSERLFDRLGTDADFFERVAACEDDLILRWHHSQLSAAEREQFERAYATPARQHRIRAALAIVQAGEAWRSSQTMPAAAHPATERRIGSWRWWRAPIAMPRLAIATGTAFLVLAVAVTFWPWAQPPGSDTAGPNRSLTFATTLTAIGDKGPGEEPGRTRNYDRVVLPVQTDVVQLRVKLDAPVGQPLTAEVLSVDAGQAHSLPVEVHPAELLTTAVVTMSASDLPNGDYVLTLARADGNRSTVISRHAFRVSRAGR